MLIGFLLLDEKFNQNGFLLSLYVDKLAIFYRWSLSLV